MFLVLLFANLYYAYSTLINTKSWLDKYGTHHSAVLLTRILGSLISGFVLIGIYILFTSTAGTWSYFATLFISYSIMTIAGIYSVEVDYPNNYKGKEGFELLKNINHISQAPFEKRPAIFAKDDIAGPLACACVLRNMKSMRSEPLVLGSADSSM